MPLGAQVLAAPSSATWTNAGVGSMVDSLVSEGSPFDARRTAPVKPPPRLLFWRFHAARAARRLPWSSTPCRMTSSLSSLPKLGLPGFGRHYGVTHY